MNPDYVIHSMLVLQGRSVFYEPGLTSLGIGGFYQVAPLVGQTGPGASEFTLKMRWVSGHPLMHTYTSSTSSCMVPS